MKKINNLYFFKRNKDIYSHNLSFCDEYSIRANFKYIGEMYSAFNWFWFWELRSQYFKIDSEYSFNLNNIIF
jgi:hypothetical protein